MVRTKQQIEQRIIELRSELENLEDQLLMLEAEEARNGLREMLDTN